MLMYRQLDLFMLMVKAAILAVDAQSGNDVSKSIHKFRWPKVHGIKGIEADPCLIVVHCLPSFKFVGQPILYFEG